MRAGISKTGWKPKQDMAAQAVEWWEWGQLLETTLDQH